MAHQTTLQFAIRDQQGTSLRAGPTPGDKKYEWPTVENSFALSQACMDVEYSFDGERALAIDSDKGVVNVYDASTSKNLCAIPSKGAAVAVFSAAGSYVQTWEKLTDELHASGGNLRIWDASTTTDFRRQLICRPGENQHNGSETESRNHAARHTI